MEQSTVFGLAGDYPKAVSHDRLLLAEERPSGATLPPPQLRAVFGVDVSVLPLAARVGCDEAFEDVLDGSKPGAKWNRESQPPVDAAVKAPAQIFDFSNEIVLHAGECGGGENPDSEVSSALRDRVDPIGAELDFITGSDSVGETRRELDPVLAPTRRRRMNRLEDRLSGGTFADSQKDVHRDRG